MRTTILLFPAAALLASAVAWFMPGPLAALRPQIPLFLVAIMFAMGLTLAPADFVRVSRNPRAVAAGIVLQFGIMPAAGWSVAHLLGLPPALAIGVILVGTCPGGTASNVICYLARGNVALSITVTACSTLLAPLLTPLLTWRYAGTSVNVPLLPMFASVAEIVLLPVVAGIVANRFASRTVAKLQPALPLVSMTAIVMVIAVIVAVNRDAIGRLGTGVAVAVVLHNTAGLALGYIAARALGLSRIDARTLAIETGMQNSGLAVALASQFFSATSALAGALFSVWHNLSGAALAAWWCWRDDRARLAGPG